MRIDAKSVPLILVHMPPKILYKRDVVFKKRQKLQGMRPVTPSNMTMTQYQKLFKEWNRKLQDSGHNDIENIYPTPVGTFTPFFRKDPQSMTLSRDSTHALEAYDSNTEEYYRMCRIYLEHCNWKQKFKRMHGAYKFIFSMHTNGAAYNTIAKYFRTDAKTRLKLRQKYDVRPPSPTILRRQSIFWVHTHIQKILACMFEWHKTHPDGLSYIGIEE